MNHQPGEIIHNRYLIKDIIAQGGMGAVYLAYDQNLHIQVALKENLVLTDDSSRQFHREATMLGGLRQPNLPRVTDHFVIPNQGEYLVMDYIDGKDLRQILNDSGVFPVEKCVQIGVTICDALSYLHQLTPPIIHRDIKPSNIKISSSGQIYLVDFGLAKIHIEEQLTATGAQSLTPGYAPPEQYGKGTDARSDGYALGATLYAILTNHVPSDGLARLVGAETLTPIQEFRPDVPLEVSKAIETAMIVEKDKRFQNILEFKAALLGLPYIPAPAKVQNENFSAPLNAPIPQKESSDPQTVILQSHPSPVKGNSVWRLIAWACGSLVLIIAFAFWVFPLIRDKALSPDVVKPSGFPAPTGSLATNSVTTLSPVAAGLVTQPPYPSVIPSNTVKTPILASQTPSGGILSAGKIAFTSERSGSPQIWLMNSDGTASKQITDLPDGACQPAWAPQGDKLVFISPCKGLKDQYPGSSLFMVYIDGTGLNPLPSVPGGDFDPSWSPDGTRIAFSSLRSGMANIHILTLSDKKVVSLNHPNTLERRPVWSPDGAYLAYQSARFNQNQIWVVKWADLSHPTALTSLSSAAVDPAWSLDGQSIVFCQGTPLPWLALKPTGSSASPEKRLSDVRPALQPVFLNQADEILFVTGINNHYEINKMALADGKITPITSDPSSNYDPAFWFPTNLKNP